MSASNMPSARPLADYTVLDLSIARAGPVAVRLLAERHRMCSTSTTS